jgi:hypothetical protein
LEDDEELEDEVGGGNEDVDGGSTPFVPSVGLQRLGTPPVEATNLQDIPPVPPAKDRT